MIRRALLPSLLAPCFIFAQETVTAPTSDLAGLSTPATVPAPSMPAFQAGILALKGERPQEAITYLTRELAEHPQNAKAWYYRGVCHANTGNAPAALSDLDRALELMPNDANALLRRSELNTANNAYDAAITDLETVLRTHQAGPIAEHALMGVGEVRMRQGDHIAAIAVYERLVAIAPNDARSWFNRGVANGHNNAHQKAYDDLSKAIKLDGWMHKAYTSRAIELVHLDRKPDACADLAKAKELGDDSVDELRAIYCE